MNFLDIAILVILGAFLVKGLIRGFLKELLSLVGIVTAAFLAFRFYVPLAEAMAQTFDLPVKFCSIAAFLLLFIVTFFVFALLGHLLSRLVKVALLGGFNRVVGGLFGVGEGVILLAVVLFAISLRPLPLTVQTILKESELAPPFVRLGESVVGGGKAILSDRR